MATIDLGKVAFVWKGTYNSGTTYEEKDVVQYTDSGELSSYIYVNASSASGQTPSTGGTVNTTYWSKMAGGTSLSVGNNKVVTTDASGNVSSLAIGTAGQALKVNSGATGFEFGTIAGYTDSDALTLLNAGGSAPVFACRVWANITGGTGALRDSGNVSSVSDLGTGNYQININTALEDANYVVVGESVENWNSSSNAHNDHNNFALKRKIFSTSAFEVESRNSANTNVDHEMVCCAAFR